MSLQHDIRDLLYVLLLVPQKATVFYDDGTEMHSVETTTTIDEILVQSPEALYGFRGCVIKISDIKDYIGKYVR